MNDQFLKIVKNRFKFKLFLFLKLPLAFIAGLKMDQIDNQLCELHFRFKWLNQNPFRSVYFAALEMGAELSTGLPAFGMIYNVEPKVLMLLVGNQATYHKKAVGKIRFKCTDIEKLHLAMKKVRTGTPQTVIMKSEALNEQYDIIASFQFEWSFKQRSA